MFPVDSTAAGFLGMVSLALAWGAWRSAGYATGQGTKAGAGPPKRRPDEVTTPGPVEVTGTIACREPVVEPAHGNPAVYFRARLEQEVVPQGHDPEHPAAPVETRVVEHDLQAVPFRLQGERGSITVLLEDATVEGRDLGKRPRRRPEDPHVRRETLRVEALRVGERITVRAHAVARGGGLVLGRDPKGRDPFLVRLASKDPAPDAGTLPKTTLLRMAAVSLGLFGVLFLRLALR